MTSTMKYASLDFGTVEAVVNKLGGMDGVKRFLSGELVVSERAPKPIPPPAPEVPLDFTVRVDRAVKPAYPSWSDKVMHPELECTGPAEFNLQRDVEQWLHPDQPSVVKGDVIYKALKRDNALADQLGLADLLAIQAKGIAVFRKLYAGKAVFGWKSVVRYRDDRRLSVPYLYERGGRVVLHWDWLDGGWGSDDPALRFRK